MRSRHQSQAIVEFGLIALLFTLLVFAVIDFGLLLNTWLSVSNASRELARSASVGKNSAFLLDEASSLNVPSVNFGVFPTACCSGTSAIEVRVEYFKGSQTPPACPPWQSGCSAFTAGSIDNRYPAGDLGVMGGCSPSPSCHPISDDTVQVTVTAHGAQVITPLVRPFFGCSNGSNPNCYVDLTTRTTMRYEGAEF
jgi:hypothetical protein